MLLQGLSFPGSAPVTAGQLFLFKDIQLAFPRIGWGRAWHNFKIRSEIQQYGLELLVYIAVAFQPGLAIADLFIEGGPAHHDRFQV